MRTGLPRAPSRVASTVAAYLTGDLGSVASRGARAVLGSASQGAVPCGEQGRFDRVLGIETIAGVALPAPVWGARADESRAVGTPRVRGGGPLVDQTDADATSTGTTGTPDPAQRHHRRVGLLGDQQTVSVPGNPSACTCAAPSACPGTARGRGRRHGARRFRCADEGDGSATGSGACSCALRRAVRGLAAPTSLAETTAAAPRQAPESARHDTPAMRAP